MFLHRSWVLQLVIVFFAMGTAAFADEPLSTMSIPPEIQRIVDRGKLVVAMLERDSEPFFYTDTQGRFTGADVDIAKGLAAELGVSVEFRREAKTYEDLVQLVMQPDVDVVISNFSKSSKRAMHLLFTRTYLEEKTVMFANRTLLAKNNITSISCPVEQKITLSVMRGTFFVDEIRSCFPQVEIVSVDTLEELNNNVIKGITMASVGDEVYQKRLLYMHPEYNLYLKAIPIDKKDEVAIAVPWTSPALRDFINVYLDVNEIQYTVDTLFAAYPNAGSAK